MGKVFNFEDQLVYMVQFICCGVGENSQLRYKQTDPVGTKKKKLFMRTGVNIFGGHRLLDPTLGLIHALPLSCIPRTIPSLHFEAESLFVAQSCVEFSL